MASINQEHYPVGTPEEVRAIGGDPLEIPTCSMPSRQNKGCTWFPICRARAFRDRKDGKMGPANGAVFIQLSDAEGGHADIREVSCFGYFTSGLGARYEQTREPGEIIKILGWEGDGKKYDMRETRRAHEKPEPNCQACAEKKCYAIEEKVVAKELHAFPRPGAAFKGMALGQKIREQLEEEQEREHDTIMMERAGGKEKD